MPLKLPTPCMDLSYLSIRINFNDLKEISAAQCLFKSSSNLRELEILVSTNYFSLLLLLVCDWIYILFLLLYEVIKL